VSEVPIYMAHQHHYSEKKRREMKKNKTNIVVAHFYSYLFILFLQHSQNVA